MPVMDGIELTKRIREEKVECEFIYITAFSEFDYLKSALAHQVFDYILKPVELELLDEALTGVIERVRTRRRRRMVEREYRVVISEADSRRKALFIKSLCTGGIADESSFIRGVEKAELTLPAGGTYVLSVTQLGDLTQRDQTLALAAQSRTPGLELYSYPEENRVVSLFCFRGGCPPDEIDEILELLLTRFINDLREIVTYKFHIGLSSWKEGWAAIPELLDEAEKALDSGFSRKEQPISRYYGDLFTSMKGHERLNHHLLGILGDIERGRENPLDDQLERLVSEIKRIPQIGSDEIKGCFISLLAQRAYQRGKPGYLAGSYGRLLRTGSLEECEDEFRTLWSRLEESDSSERRFSRVIEDVKRHIESRFTEPLTIDQIASEVLLTPSYVCHLFKQETGETIIGFLSRIRVEEAQRIIQQRDYYKLYEIPPRVGFSDYKYFTRVFRKVTGKSPREFAL